MKIIAAEEILEYLHLDIIEQSNIKTLRTAAINICDRILRKPISADEKNEEFAKDIPENFQSTVNTAIAFICWQLQYNRKDYDQNKVDNVVAIMFEVERKPIF